jgi:hypothetical protein
MAQIQLGESSQFQSFKKVEVASLLSLV